MLHPVFTTVGFKAWPERGHPRSAPDPTGPWAPCNRPPRTPDPSRELVPIDPSAHGHLCTPVHGARICRSGSAARGAPGQGGRGCQVLEAGMVMAFTGGGRQLRPAGRATSISFPSPGISAFTLTSTPAQGREGRGGPRTPPPPALDPEGRSSPIRCPAGFRARPRAAAKLGTLGPARRGHTTALLAAAIPTQARYSQVWGPAPTLAQGYLAPAGQRAQPGPGITRPAAVPGSSTSWAGVLAHGRGWLRRR